MLKRSILLQKAKNFVSNIFVLNQAQFKYGFEMENKLCPLSNDRIYTEALHRELSLRSTKRTATYPGSVWRSKSITSSSPLSARTCM